MICGVLQSSFVSYIVVLSSSVMCSGLNTVDGPGGVALFVADGDGESSIDGRT